MDFFAAKKNIDSAYTSRNKIINIYPGIISDLALILRTVLCFCLLNSTAVKAANQSILIVGNNKVQINLQVSKILTAFLLKADERGGSVDSIHYQNILQNRKLFDQASLLITLGVKATLQVQQPLNIPTINALIPQSALKEIGICDSNQCPKLNSKLINRFAIYLDQPLSRQLDLVSLLLPSAKKMGVLTASFSATKLQPLQAEAKKRNIEISQKYVENTTMLNRQLNQLINSIDVLFTLPDPMLHNKATIPNLLLSTYRYNIPVIGFSKAYVNAGAIAAVYSTVEQIAQQISELSMDVLFSIDRMSQSVFPPKYFSIDINKRVADSLGLHLADKQRIKTDLLLLEK